MRLVSIGCAIKCLLCFSQYSDVACNEANLFIVNMSRAGVDLESQAPPTSTIPASFLTLHTTHRQITQVSNVLVTERMEHLVVTYHRSEIRLALGTPFNLRTNVSNLILSAIFTPSKWGVSKARKS